MKEDTARRWRNLVYHVVRYEQHSVPAIYGDRWPKNNGQRPVKFNIQASFKT